ncbi:MAG: homoserine dehydrogenase [Rhodospirillales bacterium]|nr:homoserine dehydrogenase [Rhodospirillales bacterium]
MTQVFRIGIAGLGTVGVGVVKILQQHAAVVSSRAGIPVEITAVSARSPGKDRGVDLSGYEWSDDPLMLADDPRLDAVVELIGGADGVAYDLAKKTLLNGKVFITANKALVAHHGRELACLAEDNNTALLYEAAVAGGIPIIKALREGYAANDMRAVYGILNGTCNYILTAMRETGGAFDDILKEAQDKGYAESDPSFDIEGTDAAHKLCILSALSFGVQPDFEALGVQGITGIASEDIEAATALGYKIKLLGVARRLGDKISQSVSPCLVPEDSPIAAVEGVFNAVEVTGDFVDTGLLVGRGAGEGPTASSVVADIIDAARGIKLPAFGVPVRDLKTADWAGPQDIHSRFYLRLTVMDQTGVLAEVTALLRDYGVSMESVMQHGHDSDRPVALIMTTHEARQSDVEAACEKIAALPSVVAAPTVMRIESA